MLRIVLFDLAICFWPQKSSLVFSCLRTIVAVIAFGLYTTASAQTAPACAPEMARFTSVQGEVDVRHGAAGPWREAALGDVLCMGSGVRVGPYSRAALVFDDNSTHRLDENTELFIREREDERRTWIEMLSGAIHFFSHEPRSLGILTPFVNAAAEGTEFLIRVGGTEAHILMFEGVVLAQNEAGELRLGPDDAALIRAGERPIPEIVVRPRDAVAWAVHYPPVLSVLADGSEPGTYRHEVKNALDWISYDNYRYALRSLDEIPSAERAPRDEVLRAGILLNVGRVQEAEAAIERALAIDADAADAYALRTILHVTRNQRAQALRDADRAVTLAPTSSTALIAQSYARQASFDLEGARKSLREAVEKNPNDALAFARLAEIELSFADYDRANDAADQAVFLAPNLARTQTVQGFSHLAAIDTGAARTAFTRAIELYSADPLPHLGQGLAKIRDGFLEDGRRDLEIAASLDPNNALIRSYLGKAYFEEKRGPKDATQFEIAKKLDPNDPTPWFYDAIRKQTENRPVEALRDLERAIELNDNRAVYRSRLLLDQDLAARGVSLARIYDDLGFEKLGVIEATRSLNHDPANYSAHRFLADSYATIPRHEIARVSELLRSQLLQPININAPNPAEITSRSDLNKEESRFGIASNEFSELLLRNQISAVATGTVGNNDTVQDALSLSVVKEKWSISAGQFYSDSNGFRENNESKNEFYDILSQVSINPKLALQVGYQYRRKKQGDLRLRFDPDFFYNDRRKLKQEVVRAGLRYNTSSQSSVLASVLYTDFKEPIKIDLVSRFLEAETDEKGYQTEIQYNLSSEYFDMTAGSGFYNADTDKLFDGLSSSDDTKQHNQYIYTNYKFLENGLLEAAVSYDAFERGSNERKQFNPKIGLQWQITDRLSVRAAAVRVLKRALVFDQTIEPTQISGFNQFYDDLNGTSSWRYGAGLDGKLTSESYLGIEWSQRDIKVPWSLSSGLVRENQKETLLTSYLYWLFSPKLTFNLEGRYETFKRESSKVPDDRPLLIKTMSIPIGIHYFSNGGIFAKLVGNFVTQKVDLSPFQPFDKDQDEFFTLDVDFGYKFRNGNGILKLDIRNIFDKEFFYQNEDIQTSTPSTPRFFPDRTLLVSLTLKF